MDKDRSTALQSGKLSAEDAANSRPKILIVEDEALVGLEIEGVLCGAGSEVLGPARSVAEAMQLLMAFPAPTEPSLTFGWGGKPPTRRHSLY